jgi:SpoVK/Ycf46/Vps4 family AAA+-type ATPase
MSRRHEKIMVIGATNRPQDLDPAMQRRFEQSVEIPYPDQTARVDILRKLLNDVPKKDNFDFENVAVSLNGYSSSDIFNVCRTTIMARIVERKKARLESPENASKIHSTKPLTVEVRLVPFADLYKH